MNTEKNQRKEYEQIVRRTTHSAYADGTLPSIIDGDFAAKGKAYRRLTQREWSEVTSITMERQLRTQLVMRLCAAQSMG